MRSRNHVESFPGRIIPTPEFEPFDIPMLSTITVVRQSDLRVLARLTYGFKEVGVLERESEIIGISPDKLNDVVDEAIRHSKSEKELNPEGYDAKVEETLNSIAEHRKDWENPSLDGRDDYGNQVYKDSRNRLNEVSPGGEKIKVILDNGEVVSGIPLI